MLKHLSLVLAFISAPLGANDVVYQSESLNKVKTFTQEKKGQEYKLKKVSSHSYFKIYATSKSPDELKKTVQVLKNNNTFVEVVNRYILFLGYFKNIQPLKNIISTYHLDMGKIKLKKSKVKRPHLYQVVQLDKPQTPNSLTFGAPLIKESPSTTSKSLSFGQATVSHGQEKKHKRLKSRPSFLKNIDNSVDVEFGEVYKNSERQHTQLLWQTQGAWDLSKSFELRLGLRYLNYLEQSQTSVRRNFFRSQDSFLRYHTSTFSLTAGYQEINWSRIEESQIINRFSRQDLTRVIINDYELRQFGHPLLRTELQWGKHKFDLVYTPFFEANVLPEEESIWFFINTQDSSVFGQGQATTGLNALQGLKVRERRLDEETLAFRLTSQWGKLETGLTYMKYTDPTPLINLDLSQILINPGSALLYDYFAKSMLGLDLSYVAGPSVFLFEYAQTSDDRALNQNFSVSLIDRADIGLSHEYTFDSIDLRLVTTLQMFQLNSDVPLLLKDSDTTLSHDLTYTFQREQWEASFRFLYSLQDKGLFYRLGLKHALSSHLSLFLNYLSFGGDETSQLAFFKNNSHAVLGFKGQF